MAKFSQTLQEPKPQSSPVAPVTDDSTARALQSIGDIASSVGSIFRGVNAREAKLEAERKVVERGAAIGTATEQLLDLEDLRNKQSQQQSEQQSEAFEIHRDGQITPQEQLRLDELERQKNKFALLDPRIFQTRSNALHKQALSDTANLAIQPQINALFQQGRSRIVAPTTTNEDKFNGAMDAQYGIGNWTGIDAGREKAKVAYTRDLVTRATADFNLVADEAALSFSTFGQTAVRKVDTVLRTQGFLSDEDKNQFLIEIGNANAGVTRQVEQAVLANRKNGIDISESASKFLGELNQSTAAYTALLEGEKRFGDRTNAQNVMKSSLSIMNSVNGLRNKGVANSAAATIGGGSGGDIIAMATMLQNPATFDAVIANLPSNLRGSITKESMMEQGAKVIAAAFSPGVSMRDLTKFGVSPTIALSVGGIGLESSDVKQTTDNYLSIYEDAKYEDTESVMDMLNSPKKVNNIKTNKGDMVPVATHLLNVITSEITVGEREFLQVNDDGSLEIKIPNDPATRARVSRFSLYTNKLLKKYNLLLDNYASLLPNKEQFTNDLLQTETKQEAKSSGQEVLSDTGKKTSEGRPVFKNQFGDFVTERTITESIPELNGWFNIPTVFEGKFLTPKEAIQKVIDSGGKDPVTGRKLQRFNEVDEAVDAAETRSAVKLSNEMKGL